MIIPEHSEVANAVGAASGKVVETMDALIRSIAEDGFILHSPWQRKVLEDLTDSHTNPSYSADLYLDTKVQAAVIGRPNWFCTD